MPSQGFWKSENFVLNLCKISLVIGLLLYVFYLILVVRSDCSATNFFTPLQNKSIPNYSHTSLNSDESSERISHNGDSPTNISHLVFGLVSAIKSWRDRKPWIESWWRPNITRGYLILDKPDIKEFLPWPSSHPPYIISDDTSALEKVHKYPIMVRMVHAILETFRKDQKGVRWYIMAFDDSVFFVDNWVKVLAKYDHTKYYYVGCYSETVMSNMWYSFEQGFGGAGIALSYPLAKAMAKEIKGCIRRYPDVRSADTIIQYCVDEFGVPLTVEKGIHQIDLLGDISGFLSARPQSPLVSLHHLDYVDPMFPSMDRFQSLNHLMKAANLDQSRILQQTICYDKKKKWSISVSWGYSVHIYEMIHPRSMLKRPLETFKPWVLQAKPPQYMFNTRWPCETPSFFFFESIEKISKDEIVTIYARSMPPAQPDCQWKPKNMTNHILKIRVISLTTMKEIERSECCEISQKHEKSVAEVRLRACKDGEIIG